MESEPIERLLTSQGAGQAPVFPLSLSLDGLCKVDREYKKWHADIPNLEDDDWEDCLGSYVTTMIGLSNFTITEPTMHLSTWLPCIPLFLLPVPIFHMVWLCPSRQLFWTEVVVDINTVCGLTGSKDPAFEQGLSYGHIC